MFGLYAEFALHAEPRWIAISALMCGCVTLIWGFSASYAYNWEMFGNSIITETFSLLNPPDVKAVATPSSNSNAATTGQAVGQPPPTP